jgi:hypothetical protein
VTHVVGYVAVRLLNQLMFGIDCEDNVEIDNDTVPIFITKEMQAEMIAAGYEFKPPVHIRTQSITDLFGWQPGESLLEAINRHSKQT